MTYAFEAMTRGDLPMIKLWLGTPEVVRWWGKPGEELDSVTDDLDVPEMAQWIVALNGVAFAYVQSYPVHRWAQPSLSHLPMGAVGIDAFVGVPAMMGCGHGSAFLRAFAETLVGAGSSCVAIDPDVRNVRARRAYARAGFVDDRQVSAEGGTAMVMVYRASND